MTWEERAACLEAEDRDDWFADAGDHDARRRALAVCQACPVRVECLEEAIRRRWPGIWGATTGPERLRLIRA